MPDVIIYDHLNGEHIACTATLRPRLRSGHGRPLNPESEYDAAIITALAFSPVWDAAINIIYCYAIHVGSGNPREAELRDRYRGTTIRDVFKLTTPTEVYGWLATSPDSPALLMLKYRELIASRERLISVKNPRTGKSMVLSQLPMETLQHVKRGVKRACDPALKVGDLVEVTPGVSKVCTQGMLTTVHDAKLAYEIMAKSTQLKIGAARFQVKTREH